MKNALTLLFILIGYKATAQISGKVTGENGEILPYATVYVKNTSNGTVTNSEGIYRLSTGKGMQEIVFQYIGYKQRVEKINVGDKAVRLDVQLEPSDLQLNEVVVSSKDPAIRIMQQVIENRAANRKKLANYSADVYIKGLYRLASSPKKIMGQKVGNMGGTLDSTGAGVIYLSESVSKVWEQDPPGRKKEVMVSSKVSGSPSGFSMNRATITDFNLYEEHVNIEQEILSPLADNAFSYYRFKHAGRFTNELGFTVERIKVIPKRPSDPVFSGFLYVVDNLWLLAGADLKLTGAAINQPVLDTLRIEQQFVPLGTRDTWALLTQLTSFEFGILGFKVNGFYNGVFSNYNLNPEFDPGLFSKESFRVEDKANEQSSQYWAETRPVPLTEEENKDYVKKDSLQTIWNSKAYMDSIDRKGNRFRFNNLLFGYSWDNSYKHVSLSYPAAFKWVQFNTVQGWLLDVRPEWEKKADKQGTRNWKVSADLNYGFAEQKLRANARVQHRFESIKYRTLSVEGGTTTAQFNAKNPISPLINTLYSLFDKRNYLKLYDKTYAGLGWSQILNSAFSFQGQLEWAQRSALRNHSDFTWKKKTDREYTPNAPVELYADENQNFFAAPNILTVDLVLNYRPGRSYSSYPKYRIYTNENWPEFSLAYKKALPLKSGSWADFDHLRFQIRQEDASWGLAGYTEWMVGAGIFLNKSRMSFMDLAQPIGNQTIFGDPSNYDKSFMQLPYYAFATNQPYVQAHLQHHLEGWALDKIPLLRKLNWKEVIGAHFYYAADQPSRDAGYDAYHLPYWELSLGFENIGVKAIRPLRVDFSCGFFQHNIYTYGVILGLNL